MHHDVRGTSSSTPQEKDAAREREADDREQLRRESAKVNAQHDRAADAPQITFARRRDRLVRRHADTTALSPASTMSMKISCTSEQAAHNRTRLTCRVRAVRPPARARRAARRRGEHRHRTGDHPRRTSRLPTSGGERPGDQREVRGGENEREASRKTPAAAGYEKQRRDQRGGPAVSAAANATARPCRA